MRDILLESYGVSHAGCVRPDNEDRILVDDDLGLYLVADGMGGQKHGELAADLAVSTVRNYVRVSRDRCDVTWPFGYSFEMSVDANRVSTAIRLANRQVWHCAEQGPEFVGMGSTIAAVLFEKSSAVIGNIGDSRVYLFRKGSLTQLTIDDTWVASLFGTGLLGPEEARRHPMRNVLTQAVGSQETVEVHIREQEACQGDLFLVSSDGLHGVLDEQAIGSLLSNAVDLEKLGACLLRAAQERNAPDNVSAVLLRYGSGRD